MASADPHPKARCVIADSTHPTLLAERATLLLFVGRRVKAEFFEEVPGGVALSKEGREAFLP